MGRPRMLLLDEPSLGLAPLVAARIMQLIGELRELSGLTVLLVEQNARSALSRRRPRRRAQRRPGRRVRRGRRGSPADDQLRHAYLGF